MTPDPKPDVTLYADSATLAAIRRGRKTMLRAGIGMAIVGALAILFPMFSTFAVQFMIGGVLLFAGITMLAGSFAIRGTGPFFGAMLLGLLTFGAGMFLLFSPAAGAVALTLLIAVLFMLHGAFEAALALAMRPAEGWGWMLFSALMALLAGVLVAAGLPGSSAVILGLLVGVNFLTSGMAFIMLAQRVKPLG